MPVLGITGGIASGKSSLTKLLQMRLDALVFDADRCAHDLLESDAAVQNKMKSQFPAQCDAGGKVDRPALRELVFRNPEKRIVLEEILHPRIRSIWISQIESNECGRWLLLDIPLLYETEADKILQRVVVVACSPTIQMRRLIEDRNLTPETAGEIIKTQMPLSEKIDRADHVVWNDGTPASLEAQAELLAANLLP